MHSDFRDAYAAGLRDLLSTGRVAPPVRDATSPASNFGQSDRPAIEKLGHRFEIEGCVPAIVWSPERPPNLPFCIGLALWTLAGSDSVEWLAYYNEIAPRFSEDKLRLCGSFGHRMFKSHGDQVLTIKERLTADPGSRRAFLAIISGDDNSRAMLDYPCAIGMQLFIRDGKLHAVTYMRAQQALTVLPYDFFVFSTLQAAIAAQLNLPVGSYVHFAGTFHIYQSEWQQAQALVASGVGHLRMPPVDDADADFAQLLSFEQALRDAATRGDLLEVDRLIKKTETPPDTYQGVAARILKLHAWKKAGRNVEQLVGSIGLSPQFEQLSRAHWCSP